MSEQAQEGYAYRRARASRGELLALIGRLLPDELWFFSGATQWEFDAQDGRGNLRPIQSIAAPTAGHLTGDFGHFFGDAGEVRWRRVAEDGYDVLVLREAALVADEQERLGLGLIGTFSAQAVPGRSGVLIEEGHGRLGVVEYRDSASRAIRLVRFTGRLPAGGGGDDARA